MFLNTFIILICMCANEHGTKARYHIIKNLIKISISLKISLVLINAVLNLFILLVINLT